MDLNLDYNVGYIACSFIVMVIVALRYFGARRVYTIRNVLFGALILVALFEMASDIISSIIFSYASDMRKPIVFLSNQFFYLLQFVLPYLMFAFNFALTNNLKKYYKLLGFYAIPLVFCLILWILNFATPTLFYFDSTTYYKTSLNVAVYISAAFYLVSTAISAIFLRKQIGDSAAGIMFLGGLTCIGVVLVQIVFPYVLLTGLGIMITMLLMYIYLNNNDSLIDPLTGCFERSALDQYLDGGLVSKNKGYALAIVFNNFQNVNNAFGIKAGDEILRQTGKFLVDSTYYYPYVNVYRIMGHVFLIPFPNKKSYEKYFNYFMSKKGGAYKVANQEVDIKPNVYKIEDIDYSEKTSDLTSCIMYGLDKANKEGDYGVVLLDNSFKEEYQFTKNIEVFLNEAIDKKLFYMVYQPIYSTKENKFTMLEALVRLKHPVYGFVSPDIFIKSAERQGLISDITDLVLDMVSDFISKNNIRKLGIENVKINLSAMDLMDGELSNRIEKIFTKKNVDPEIVGFEITETVATTFNNEASKFFKYVDEKGLKLSIDDFGSGYANLSNVMKINFDVLKMDRSMLLAINDTKEGKDIYKNIAKLFQKLGKKIVSEGAETSEEVTMLTKWGIDYIQGFYYSKPLEDKQLLTLLTKEGKHKVS